MLMLMNVTYPICLLEGIMHHYTKALNGENFHELCTKN
jgi:hypothetical protein